MILQNDRRLNIKIQKYGCYFMSMLFLANMFKGIELSIEKIEQIYNECISKNFMNINCYISNPDKILTYLGLSCEYNNRHDSAFYKCNRNEIEILCIKYPTYKHFVVGDGNGNILYNPMGLTAPNGYIESKRVFKLL